jgi:hypothetical protein
MKQRNRSFFPRRRFEKLIAAHAEKTVATARIFISLVAMVVLQSQVVEAELITGVNVDIFKGKQQRDAVFEQLKAANVKVLRFNIRDEDTYLDYAKRLYDAGIKIIFLGGPAYPKDAPKRPKSALKPSTPLSAGDPNLTEQAFQDLIDHLEARGVVLEAIEFGNEINWADFNGDFPVPGEGKLFSLDELSSDPEGRQVAKGFLQYLKCLAKVKDVRDHSKLNQKTPIISAGLTDFDLQWPTPKMKLDSVSFDAALHFLRDHGLDDLVDAYGIHRYPTQKTAQERKSRIFKVCSQCHSTKSHLSKPCWITEWGINNEDTNCPPDDKERAKAVEDCMDDFRELNRQGRLVGVVYFSWNFGSKERPGSVIYRCDQLLESGKRALKP